jgi:hypothetical protein
MGFMVETVWERGADADYGSGLRERIAGVCQRLREERVGWHASISITGQFVDAKNARD